MPSEYNNRHLFIIEGPKGEDKNLKKIGEYFSTSDLKITVAYGGNIYDLYKQLKECDFGLELVGLLKEKNNENKKILGELSQEDFESIILFFDYDGHDSAADDNKLMEMIEFFDNEHDNGQLYVSYPMVEAFRHYKDFDSFKDLTVKCKRRKCPYIETCPEKEECKNEDKYKTLVHKECKPVLQNLHNYDQSIFYELINAHLCKMNYIVNDEYLFPVKITQQSAIFKNQLEKYINKDCPHVAVLSSFPIYLLDYYGIESMKNKLGR